MTSRTYVLSGSHPLAGMRCEVCDQIFQAGDEILLQELEDQDDEAEKRKAASLPYHAACRPVHVGCDLPLAHSITRLTDIVYDTDGFTRHVVPPSTQTTVTITIDALGELATRLRAAFNASEKIDLKTRIGTCPITLRGHVVSLNTSGFADSAVTMTAEVTGQEI